MALFPKPRSSAKYAIIEYNASDITMTDTVGEHQHVIKSNANKIAFSHNRLQRKMNHNSQTHASVKP